MNVRALGPKFAEALPNSQVTLTRACICTEHETANASDPYQ